jgi:hypothetical protein
MYAGNSVVINILMRWPVLIPVAIATTAVTMEPPAPPPAPPKQEVVVAPPPPVAASAPQEAEAGIVNQAVRTPPKPLPPAKKKKG